MALETDKLFDKADEAIAAVETIVEESEGYDNSQYNSARPNEGSGAMNPFNEELGAQKLSDSNQMQDSYHDTGSGWIPFHAKDKRPIRLSIWDNSQVPGAPYMGRDRDQAWGGPENAMGPAPFRNRENSPNFNKLIRPSDKGFPEIKRKREEAEQDDAPELRVLIPEASSRRGILKISSDDDYWMAETVRQMNLVVGQYASKLGEVFGGFWRILRPMKDGNTLRFHWSQGSGINIKKFLLYIRYNAGSDTYSVSSSAYDGESNQEKTLVNWTDDVYVDMLMDPNIWIKGE